jgi:hypothetical protein
MKKTIALLAVLVSLVPVGSLLAHHSIANFDTTTPIRVKGTVVQIHLINPHSFIYVEEKGADGKVRRWAAEGPGLRQATRAGFTKDTLKVGDIIEVCGYAPKEATMWQIASADPTAVSLAGRLLNAEQLVMPDGQERNWGDYGVHKCFTAGFKDVHSK